MGSLWEISDKSVLIQVMAWCWTGNKPSLKSKMIKIHDHIYCHYATMI